MAIFGFDLPDLLSKNTSILWLMLPERGLGDVACWSKPGGQATACESTAAHGQPDLILLTRVAGTQPHLFLSVLSLAALQSVELSSGNRDPQSPKCLPSGPLWKRLHCPLPVYNLKLPSSSLFVPGTNFSISLVAMFLERMKPLGSRR